MINYLKSLIRKPINQGYMGFRPDILGLISTEPSSILDVGCGAGGIGEDIRKKYPNCKVTGIESDLHLADMARNRIDNIIVGDLNNESTYSEIGQSKYDVIIFADVLEHLINPVECLKLLRSQLTDNGYIITSLPNVRHYATFYYLGVLGTWPRHERGLFDKTHLHFFTRKNALALLSQAGYKSVREKRNVRLIESQSWSNIPGKLFDFWPFRSFLTFQYIHQAIPHDKD